jgi:3-deoxy-manno-octulosonate cytidylyltransferase (CMP-KDO synthetase)
LGLYGIRRSELQRYTGLEVTREEQLESLEQLRWIKAGYTIGCLGIDHTSRSIDVPEDLA